MSSRFIQRCVVSTDDPEIAEVAKSFGAEVPFMRPAELAKDDSPEWLAWQHAIRTLERSEDFPPLDVFISLSPTAPLRLVEDVDACVEEFMKGDADVVITVKEASRNPYFNMISLDSERYAHTLMSSNAPIHRRQDSPKVYDMTTVAYVASPSFICRASSIFEGRVRVVTIPEIRALDIDTELDFAVAQFLLDVADLKSGKLNTFSEVVR